jgi:hypothetical protein
MQQDLVIILYGSIYNQYKIVKQILPYRITTKSVTFYAHETHFYELQCIASSNSIIYLWPDDGLVIEAETCCHLVTLNELVVFWLVNLYSLFVYIENNGDELSKY